MLTNLHNEVLHYLTHINVSLYRAKILIGLSGGKDSLCLLKILKDLTPLYKWHISVVHCDHNWREDSLKNVERVYNWTTKGTFTLYLANNQSLLTTEDKTRSWRYYLFLTIAVKFDYSLLFTAHNLNDKVETVIYNLFRGTGIDGLTTLSYPKQVSSNITICRPLITLTADDILAFCRYYYLPVWSDITNFNLYHKRNRLRQDVIPYIKKFFNPKLIISLSNISNLLELQMNYIYHRAYEIYVKIKHPSYIGINIIQYSNLHKIMQITIIKIMLKQLTLSLGFEMYINKLRIYFSERTYQNNIIYIDKIAFVKKNIYIYIARNI
uniref:tRNA(Ile)-lysidine synthase n=1 Tax=Goniotrichopsis reniformis TaxID=468933 RepID=UPI001FCCCF0D|nr:tRNA(Ile)-lysidine synthase [Goniotrichopsis reniformis]UNJ14825.1 tRNA(Ile)-lysidine synthase [Goniotrichopsis reniformis]